jgi:hypothetical protein
LLNLVHSEDFATELFVVATKSAIDAVVYTGVAGIDGGKEHKAAAVDLVLAVLGCVEDFLDVGFVFDTEEFGDIVKVKPLEFSGFVEDVVEFGLGGNVIVKQIIKLVAVNEILVSHGIKD